MLGLIPLCDRPGLVSAEQLIQVTFSLRPDNLLDLVVQHILITGSLGLVEHAEGSGQMSIYPRIVEHPPEDLGFVKVVLVMGPEIVFAKLAAYPHDRRRKTFQPDPFLALCTEYQWLTLLQE